MEGSFYEHHLLGMKGGYMGPQVERQLPVAGGLSYLSGSLVLLQKRISGGLSVKQTWAHKAA